jgi:hypothetical protein
MSKNYFVFDVESTSLHGTGFAVGAVVYNPQGQLIDKFELLSIEGESKVCEWVAENVLPYTQSMPTCETDRELRDAFFDFYMRHKDTSDIWCDAGFPVETNFLSAVAQDDIKNRGFAMPFPLKDISTLVDVHNRKEECEYLDLRTHHPLDDSIASFVCLFDALNKRYTKFGKNF